jgi:transposase
MEKRDSRQIQKEDINPINSHPSSQPGITISFSREEILALYEEGPEAIIASIQTLCSIINKQAAKITELEERIKSLEDQINKNSRNSSKPPSTDSFRKIRSQRKPSGKPVGGQKGHKGHTLEMAENPDHVIVHPVTNCESCGRSLHDKEAAGYERRQVFDLPPIKVEVFEHRAERKICPNCGCLSKATFPEEVAHSVQYGTRLKSVATYLNQYQLVPFDRLNETFVDLFGHRLSQSTLIDINRECYNILEPVEEAIKQQLIASPVICLDETGMRIEGKRKWSHVVSTENLTYYAAHNHRGSKANEDMGILPVYRGIAMHDGWFSYFKFKCKHALCNAHHIRDLSFIHEADKQNWAKDLIDHLINIKATVDLRKPIDSKLDLAEIKDFEDRYDHIIERAKLENPPPIASNSGGQIKKRGKKKKTKALNLLERLDKYRREALAFMYDFEVPFDNNLAERDQRMVKVQQKISGNFRSWEGARIFCRIRGYISTVKKNSISVIDAIQGVFEGKPFIPEKMMVAA